MRRTIGTRLGRKIPGDYVAQCAYCGANWRRSKLRRDGSGQLVCPDEGDGLDRVTLDEINASFRPRPPLNGGDGGGYSGGVDVNVTTVYFSTSDEAGL